jgi:hypothetical protein
MHGDDITLPEASSGSAGAGGASGGRAASGA